MTLYRWVKDAPFCIGLMDGDRCCANCVHYHPHYVRRSFGDFYKISWGHCSYPRLKNRKVLDVCEHFENLKRSENP